MRFKLSSILLTIVCIALAIGFYSEQTRSRIERDELVRAAFYIGGDGPESFDSNEEDNNGFSLPITAQQIAVVDLVEMINVIDDVPTVFEIVHPGMVKSELDELQNAIDESTQELWRLTGRKTFDEIVKAVNDSPRPCSIKKPERLRALIEELEKMTDSDL